MTRVGDHSRPSQSLPTLKSCTPNPSSTPIPTPSHPTPSPAFRTYISASTTPTSPTFITALFSSSTLTLLALSLSGELDLSDSFSRSFPLVASKLLRLTLTETEPDNERIIPLLYSCTSLVALELQYDGIPLLTVVACALPFPATLVRVSLADCVATLYQMDEGAVSTLSLPSLSNLRQVWLPRTNSREQLNNRDPRPDCTAAVLLRECERREIEVLFRDDLL